MNKRLIESLQERIAERYREHPLMKACRAAFTDYQADMNYLLFSPVEVFVEAADIIDGLFDEAVNDKDYVAGLWNRLTIKYKLWQPGTPGEEVQTAVCSVFYAVAVSLSVCDEGYFRETLKEAILDEVYRHKSIVKQQEDVVIVRLATYANELKTWMDEYVKSVSRFSDEIQAVIKGEPLFANAVINPQYSTAVISKLHQLMEGKEKPKDVMMPVRAAMDVGAIRRPTDEEFCNEFGHNRVKGKSSINDYTNPDKTPYSGPDFEAMKNEFRELIKG